MTLRTGHGRGAGVPRVEVLPADELPAALGSVAVQPERDASGRFVPGNTAGRARKLRPGPAGLVGIDRCSPDFRPFARWGARYAGHRRRELAAAHGGTISAGVGAIVESAALAMAASRYLDHCARQSGDPELFKQAAQLGQTARQHELAAWELAAREAQARPKAPLEAAPWLVAPAATRSRPQDAPAEVAPPVETKVEPDASTRHGGAA